MRTMRSASGLPSASAKAEREMVLIVPPVMGFTTSRFGLPKSETYALPGEAKAISLGFDPLPVENWRTVR